MSQQCQYGTERLRIFLESCWSSVYIGRSQYIPKEPVLISMKERGTNMIDRLASQSESNQAKRETSFFLLPLIWATTEGFWPYIGSVSPSNNLVKKIPHRSSQWLVFSWFQIQSNWPPRITVRHSPLVSWHTYSRNPWRHASFPDGNSDQITILPTHDTTTPHITKHYLRGGDKIPWGKNT